MMCRVPPYCRLSASARYLLVSGRCTLILLRLWFTHHFEDITPKRKMTLNKFGLTFGIVLFVCILASGQLVGFIVLVLVLAIISRAKNKPKQAVGQERSSIPYANADYVAPPKPKPKGKPFRAPKKLANKLQERNE